MKPVPHFVRVTNGNTRVTLSTPSHAQAIRLAAAIEDAMVMTIEVENLEAEENRKAARAAKRLINKAKGKA